DKKTDDEKAEEKTIAQKTRVKKVGIDLSWVVELKIDGVAATLIYEDGVLVRGLTRGDGLAGDDITHNIRTLRDVPLRLNIPLGKTVPKYLEIRGEIYMRNSDLTLLNQSQKEAGQTIYANTRNVTAGSVRLLDPQICAERRLRFFAHSIGFCDGVIAKNHFDFLREIESYGISATPHAKLCNSFSDAADYCESLYEGEDNFLSALDFEIDGLVLKLNDFDLREKLGATSKYPRWVIAYKVEKYEAATQLKHISVQVGKTGVITPVAELEPVQLAGTTVSRASLHNAEEIERKDIREGDVVVVEKAGKIIPHVVRVEKHLRESETAKFDFPKNCPACNSELSKDEGGVYIRCANPECPAQLKERIRYFASRPAMDIESLGDKLIGQLVDSGLVSNFGDIYRLTYEKLMSGKIERIGERLAKKLLSNIEKSKTRDLARFISALCIRHVGLGTAKLLAKHFGTIDNLKNATEETMSNIDGIGEIIAKSLHEFLHSNYGTKTINDLMSEFQKNTDNTPRTTLFDTEYNNTKHETPSWLQSNETTITENTKHENPTNSEQQTTESNKHASNNQALKNQSPLSGLTIVVTGTLEKFKRDEIKSVIEQYGGKPTSSVSSKTNFVLVGQKPGDNKIQQAEKLGIKMINETEFIQMIKQ
ncbi:MAG: NAD-dependent DNA ligase LigA, partial [Planctomycetaceae bacterium]|nr:NAD-dependent DNA ligase LigA [Planctomycetaceae bacterium]